MEASWHRIAGIAQDLARITSASGKSTDSSGSSFVTPALELSVPSDIDAHFRQPGIPSFLINRLTKVFKEAMMTLRQAHVKNYEEACRKLSVLRSPMGLSPPLVLMEKLRVAVQASFEKQLRAWIDTHVRSILKRFRTLPSTSSSSKHTLMKKQPFNYAYVPYLEQYFENNAFPSHSDKVDLARKSLMNYRQIDVWFQNRRGRARRDGKPLKKLRADETPKQSFEQLERRMASWVIPVSERVEPVDSDLPECESQYDSDENDMSAPHSAYAKEPSFADPFITETPSHAFPCVYPPNCEHDPFFTKSGRVTFPPPVWMRRTAMSIVERPEVDLHTLVKAFDDMNLRGCAKREKRKTWMSSRGKRTCPSGLRRDRSAATLAITTKPLPAPLPSLVRTKTLPRVARLPVSVIPSVPATSRRHVFRSPSPQSRPVTLVPPAQSMAVLGRRKIAPLPKRTPTSIARRRDMLASSPLSRTPSLQSDSPKTRTYSDSSSPPSSTVATPISSPMPLREPSFTLDELFGDVPIDAPSPVKGLRLDFRPVNNIGKHPFDFSCDTLPPVRVQC